MDDKISVIVPIYNVAPYLKRCLDSIINQSYQNLEIILVNDGSTDNSLEICQQYQQQDKRIRVISQKNAGLSAARNTGIEIATGEYITFIDSDDWYATASALATLYHLIDQYHVEIAIGNFDEFDTSINKYRLYKHNHQSHMYSVPEWFNFEYEGTSNLSQCFSTAWGKIFTRNFFETLRFPVGKISEDDLTTWKLYLQTPSLAFIDQAIYIYRNNRADSITGIANPAQLFSLPAIEQRFTMEKLLGFNKSLSLEETNAYLWRLQMHRNNALKAADLTNFKQAQQNINIINKRNKVYY